MDDELHVHYSDEEMAKAEVKTKPTGENVEDFLNSISNETKRKDSLAITEMMRSVTNMEPKLWASSMVGFGFIHYTYESGHEGDMFAVGFSPRKQNLALYVLSGFVEQRALLRKLGKHKTGKVCLYIQRLDDIHLPTLRRLIQLSFRQAAKKYTVT